MNALSFSLMFGVLFSIDGDAIKLRQPLPKADTQITADTNDPVDLLSLLRLKGTVKEGPATKVLLQHLSRMKVPSAKEAVNSVVKWRFQSGNGIDAQEKIAVTGLIAVQGAGIAGHGKQELIWIVRSWRPNRVPNPVSAHALVQELWVNARTGEVRVVFPFGGDSQ